MPHTWGQIGNPLATPCVCGTSWLAWAHTLSMHAHAACTHVVIVDHVAWNALMGQPMATVVHGGAGDAVLKLHCTPSTAMVTCACLCTTSHHQHARNTIGCKHFPNNSLEPSSTRDRIEPHKNTARNTGGIGYRCGGGNYQTPGTFRYHAFLRVHITLHSFECFCAVLVCHPSV
jgi:hypothetical protein